MTIEKKIKNTRGQYEKPKSKRSQEAIDKIEEKRKTAKKTK